VRVADANRSKIPYAFYPHIIENILEYADDPTLLALLQTCRNLRAKAEMRLLRYATLGNHVLLRPDRRHIRHCAIVSPNYEPPPSLDCATIRVLDVRMQGSEGCMGDAVHTLAPLLPNLKLLRIHHDAFSPSGPMYAFRRAPLAVPEVRFLNLADFREIHIWAEPNGNGDLFFNLRYSGSLPERVTIAARNLGLRHISVYIFMTVQETKGGPYLSPQEAWKRLLTRIRTIEIKYSCTVVMVADGSQRELNGGPVLPKDVRVAYRYVDDAPSLITMSFEEMREKVGDRTFKLIMEP
jgi:hypothetical protein